MASPSELARQAQKHSEELEQEFRLLKQLVEQGDLPAILRQLVAMEARLAALEKFDAELRRVAVLDDRIAKLEARAADADRLRERVAVAEGMVAELVKSRDEAGKRGWQYVYIVVGAVLALASSFAVQLVFFLLKK